MLAHRRPADQDRGSLRGKVARPVEVERRIVRAPARARDGVRRLHGVDAALVNRDLVDAPAHGHGHLELRLCGEGAAHHRQDLPRNVAGARRVHRLGALEPGEAASRENNLRGLVVRDRAAVRDDHREDGIERVEREIVGAGAARHRDRRARQHGVRARIEDGHGIDDAARRRDDLELARRVESAADHREDVTRRVAGAAAHDLLAAVDAHDRLGRRARAPAANERDRRNARVRAAIGDRDVPERAGPREERAVPREIPIHRVDEEDALAVPLIEVHPGRRKLIGDQGDPVPVEIHLVGVAGRRHHEHAVHAVQVERLHVVDDAAPSGREDAGNVSCRAKVAVPDRLQILQPGEFVRADRLPLRLRVDAGEVSQDVRVFRRL